MPYLTRLPISTATIATAVFTLACDGSGGPTAPAASDDAAHRRSAAAALVPFKGTFTGTGLPAEIPDDRCPAITIQIQATGTATHIGRFTTVQSQCVTTTSLDFTDGEFTFTAANGDQLSGTYEGQFIPLEPPLAGIDGRFTFTGGTGRFVGVSGGGVASGTQNLATGDATVELEGTISSVGASKHGS
jgi:hypothetical protein